MSTSAHHMPLSIPPEVSRWLHDHPDESSALRAFVGLMATELAANDGKGNRPGWLTMDRRESVAEVHWHAAKLAVAAKALETGGDEAERIASGDEAAMAGAIDNVREYAADVANCALMVVDCLALLSVPHQPANPELAPHIHIGRESL